MVYKQQVDPKTKFTTQELNYLKRIVENTIKNTSSKKSYFTLSSIINQALKKSKEEEKFRRNNFLNDVVTILVNEIAEDNSKLINIDQEKKNYSTTENLISERKCVQLATSTDNKYPVSSQFVEDFLAKPEMSTISDEQKEAVYHVCYDQRMVSIYQGLAGAGKSFTSKAIKASYEARNFDVMGVALSWNAAGVLSASAGIQDCQAIEAFCIAYAKAKEQKSCIFEKDTLLIVDEAGLVGTNHMVQILEAAKDAIDNHGRIVKVVLTGDALQLLPVNAGGMFKTLERIIGSSTISTIRRQSQESQREMVRLSSERRSGNALYTMIQQENISWGTNHETTTNMLIRDFLSYKLANPKSDALILALNNNHVIEMNNKVREVYKKLGLLKGIEIETTVTDGRNKAWRSKFAAGDSVVIRSNYRDTPVYEIPKDENDFNLENYKQKRVGVFNRNNGKIVKILESDNPVGSWDIVVDMQGDLEGRMIINTERMLDGNVLPMHHNYATTIYASQGQTVDQVFAMYDPQIDFRLFYVGISRHRHNCTLYLNETLLHKAIDRDAGKAIEGAKDKNKWLVDENGDEIKTVLGRYSRADMLRNVAKNCGKAKENETCIDYMDRITRPEDKKINEAELFEIKPLDNGQNLMDFDADYYIVQAQNTLSDEARKTWWKSLYVQQKSVFVTDQNKLNTIKQDTQMENENFQKYVKDVLSYNNLPSDYLIEEGDYIHYKKKVNVRYPILNMQKVLQEEDAKYTESVVIPEKEVDRSRFKRGIEGFIPIYSDDEDKDFMNKEIQEIASLSLQGLMAEINSFAEPNLIKKDGEIAYLQENLKEEFNQAQVQEIGFDDLNNNLNLSNLSELNLNSLTKEISNAKNQNFNNENQEIYEEKALNKVSKTSGKLFMGLFKKDKTIEKEHVEENKSNDPNNLLDEIKKVKIEFLERPEDMVKINIKGNLEFTDVKYAKGDQDFLNWINYAAKDDPSTNEQRGIWHKGKYHEPRFLALDANGIIREKYDQFGNAMLGSGYPAMLTNPHADDKTPVWVVPGGIEWLWTYYFYMKKNYGAFEESQYSSLEEFIDNLSNDERQKIINSPEIIWGTQATDYGVVKEYLKGRELKVIRGKDEKNVEWAINLQEHLWNTWYLKTEIVPSLPNHEAPWLKATQDELKIAEGEFDTGDLIREIAKINKTSKPKI